MRHVCFPHDWHKDFWLLTCSFFSADIHMWHRPLCSLMARPGSCCCSVATTLPMISSTFVNSLQTTSIFLDLAVGYVVLPGHWLTRVCNQMNWQRKDSSPYLDHEYSPSLPVPYQVNKKMLPSSISETLVCRFGIAYVVPQCQCHLLWSHRAYIDLACSCCRLLLFLIAIRGTVERSRTFFFPDALLTTYDDSTSGPLSCQYISVDNISLKLVSLISFGMPLRFSIKFPIRIATTRGKVKCISYQRIYCGRPI